MLMIRLRMTLVREKIVVSILTWVRLLANVEPWIIWPQQLKLLKLWWISATAESDGLVSDEEGMDEEGFSGL